MVGKRDGKTSPGRPRSRWEKSIKIDLKEIGWKVMDWIDLAQDRDRRAGCCECGNEPLGSIKCRKFLD